MEKEIIAQLNDPKQLEQLYRSNKPLFKKTFAGLYPNLKGEVAAEIWNERLNFENEEIHWGSGQDLFFIIIAALVAGLIAKIPAIFSVNEDFFYPRNIGFIVFPALALFFAWKNKLNAKKLMIIFGAVIFCAIYINLLPDVKNSDTLILSCIHLMLFLWAILGFAFAGDNYRDKDLRLAFLKYNGDLVVMTTLILIAGGIMTGITIGLFSLIGISIEKFYFEYIAVFGAAAAPIVGTYLTQTNPQLVGKVSPVIAKIFSPLVLVMLVIYLVAIVYSGKDPYNDREFLMMFNALLLGVLAIIFFSIAESAKSERKTRAVWVLFLLAAITIIVNGVALSAIVFRISSLGITPNRLAVLGGNVLILIHLLLVSTQLFKVVANKTEIKNVGRAIAAYLPVYIIWTVIVAFVFPFLFGFR